jgi:squalene cyclase
MTLHHSKVHDHRWLRATVRLTTLIFIIHLTADAHDGVSSANAESIDGRRVDDAVVDGVEWLLEQQQADGAWRSAKYAQLKEGPGATALAVAALAEATTNEPEAATRRVEIRQAIRDGLSFLTSQLAPAGYVRSPDGASEYPTYATALTLLALERLPPSEREPYVDAIGRMRAYLAAAQVRSPLPNQLATASDVGGWGLVGGEPNDPSSFRTANVSTTRLAVEALAPVAADHAETLQLARQFLAQRQNADGGLAFLSDPLDQLNKAGALDPANIGEPFVARSYGTTTADGLLAMRAAGVAANDQRVVAAIEWLDAHPQVDAVPGFPSDEVSVAASQGLFYYYAAALARAMEAFPEAPFAVRAPDLTGELVSRQRPDGSWANTISTMREDDPLTATCFALMALSELNDQ